MGGGNSSKIISPIVGGLAAVGGAVMSAYGMPEIGVPMMGAGIGAATGGGLDGMKGALTGGMLGGSVGMGAEGAGAGSMGLGSLGSSMGASAPSGYNPMQAMSAMQSLGGAANSGLSPVAQGMNQQQSQVPPPRSPGQPIPVQQPSTATPQLPQYQAPAPPMPGGPLAQYLQFLKGAS